MQIPWKLERIVCIYLSGGGGWREHTAVADLII